MTQMYILFLLSGAVTVGFLLGFVVHKLNVTAHYLSKKEVENSYVPKGQYDAVIHQLNIAKSVETAQQCQILELTGTLSATKAQNIEWDKRLMEQTKEIQALQSKARLEFEQLSNAILEEKSKKFTHQNEENLTRLINPLKEHIAKFEENMQKRFKEESLDRNTLKGK